MNLQILLTAFIAWFIAQMTKLISDWRKHGKPDFKVLLESGGMPSSHTALVISATTKIGILEGFSSNIFSICLIFSLVIMYDATGVRRSVGLQARKLNQLLDIFHETHKFDGDKLREILGHTPIEVFGGFILGVLVAYLI
ncbi:MAG: divergent PAP2 family protein [Clostridiales bacterium]